MKTAIEMPRPYLFKPTTALTYHEIINKLTHQNRQSIKPNNTHTLEQQLAQTPRQQWLAEAAYYKAEARGFIPGHDLDDWLAAEQDYLEMVVSLFLAEFREDGDMTITGLQQLAKIVGVNKPKRIDSKLELVKAIQTACNHEPCFRTQPGVACPHAAHCQWHLECQTLLAEWWS